MEGVAGVVPANRNELDRDRKFAHGTHSAEAA